LKPLANWQIVGASLVLACNERPQGSPRRIRQQYQSLKPLANWQIVGASLVLACNERPQGSPRRIRQQYQSFRSGDQSRSNSSKTGLRRFNTQPTQVGFAVVGAISNRRPTFYVSSKTGEPPRPRNKTATGECTRGRSQPTGLTRSGAHAARSNTANGGGKLFG
jgi:hypothetical protein